MLAANCEQRFEFEHVLQVLLPPDGALRGNECLECQRTKRNIADANRIRCLHRRRIVAHSKHAIHNVDVSDICGQGHDGCRAECPNIKDEGEAAFNAAQIRVPSGQQRYEALEVVGRRVIAEINVVRNPGGALNRRRHTADHDKSHAFADKRPENGLEQDSPLPGQGRSRLATELHDRIHLPDPLGHAARQRGLEERHVPAPVGRGADRGTMPAWASQPRPASLGRVHRAQE